MGTDANTISRYTLQLYITSASILPNTPLIIRFFPRYPSTIMMQDAFRVKDSSWLVARQACSAFFFPMNCPAITAPPVASAVKMLMINTITVSIKDTPDTAASPTLATMIESASPTNACRNWSIISGMISFRKSAFEKNRFICFPLTISFCILIGTIIRPYFCQNKSLFR